MVDNEVLLGHPPYGYCTSITLRMKHNSNNNVDALVCMFSLYSSLCENLSFLHGLESRLIGSTAVPLWIQEPEVPDTHHAAHEPCVIITHNLHHYCMIIIIVRVAAGPCNTYSSRIALSHTFIVGVYVP